MAAIEGVLLEWGPELTERVADLVDGLPVVVDRLEQGQGVARVRITGAVEPLVEVALRLAGTGHTVQRVEAREEGYVAHLQGHPTRLALAWAYVRGIEGVEVGVQRA